MTTIPKILLADDDSILADMLAEYLASEGYDVSTAGNGQAALELIEADKFDLLILDIMMPVLDGIETLKMIRQTSVIPVIMVTARGDDLDRILGLELGADDYIAKPCNPRELLARVKAVLRRVGNSENTASDLLSIGDLSLNPGNRGALVGNVDISLTQTEFDLLFILMRNRDQLVTKSNLSIEVLDKPLSQWDRSIDVHISNIRKKLGIGYEGKERIRTIRGNGYLLDAAANRQ